MTSTSATTKHFIELRIDGAALRIACMYRAGGRAPVLLLHGFGGSKEDYADLALHPRLEGRAIFAYDAPGFGESTSDDPSALSIPLLCRAAAAVIAFHGLCRFHLVGHSMGGLTALMFADLNRDRLLSFTNIEGNLAPEDCFLSRQIIDHPSNDPNEFLESFIERIRATPAWSNSLYAVGLRHRLRPEAIAPVFRSMVDLTDTGELIEKFVRLPCAKMFVYGSSNRSLSYLGTLNERGVQLAEIPYSGHFPMYANPPALWTCMGEFFDRSEAERLLGEP